MKPWLILPALVVAFSALTFGQTADENLIRQTYAKAVFANQVGILEKGTPQALATNQLAFTLTDFRAGVIANNAKPLSSINSKPEEHQHLVLTNGGETYAFENKLIASETSLTAHWEPAPPPQDTTGKFGWDAPISLLLLDNPWADRFITYQVTASYAGKTETYRAVFLLGQDGRNQPIDLITDGLPWSIPLQQLYPAGLLRVLRDRPGVMDWLKANQVSAAACRSGELCCHPAGLKCGILPDDLSRELQKPAAPASWFPATSR